MANDPTLWQNEYRQRGIPSSFLGTHSGILDLLYNYLIEQKITLLDKTAADLGCGRGRNTFSLVNHGAKKVYAIDFVKSVIDSLEAQVKPKNLSNKITALCSDLTKPWPIPNQSLDIVLDIFCFKHQTDETKQQFYKSELNRKLKSGGLLLIDLAGADDGYYGIQKKEEIKPEVFKVTDPNAGVTSLLFTKESLLREFPNFDVINFVNDKKEGEMHGQTYLRSTLKFLLKKQ